MNNINTSLLTIEEATQMFTDVAEKHFEDVKIFVGDDPYLYSYMIGMTGKFKDNKYSYTTDITRIRNLKTPFIETIEKAFIQAKSGTQKALGL